MTKNELLNEESYQKTKKKLSKIGIVVCGSFILLGVILICIGIFNVNKYNDKDTLANEEQKLIQAKEQLETKIKPIEDEITKLERVPFTGFDEEYYAREDKIKELTDSIRDDRKTIILIENAMDDGFDHCAFDEYQENSYTSEYCKYKYVDSNTYLPFIIPGCFCLFAGFIASMMVLITLNRRKIMAFGMQQMMPLAQEGAEKMAPTAGKVAKEVAKGIKEGLKDEEK